LTASRHLWYHTGMKVAIIMGSESDWEIIRSAKETLDSLGIQNEVHVMSAHRSPDVVRDFTLKAPESGIGVIIAAAGGAAHLAGAVAAHTNLPVIGVPMPGGALGGTDALLATVQMPSGIPVATVAIGKAGATNSAVLAAQILALSDDTLCAKLVEFKKKLAKKVAKMNDRVREQAG
jgi:5-(carboxyamino)imidazole ribonucleotide mutase